MVGTWMRDYALIVVEVSVSEVVFAAAEVVVAWYANVQLLKEEPVTVVGDSDRFQWVPVVPKENPEGRLRLRKDSLAAEHCSWCHLSSQEVELIGMASWPFGLQNVEEGV